MKSAATTIAEDQRLSPGWYRLTKDLPALRPDRRKRHQWSAAPMAAGTLFVVRDEPGLGTGADWRSIYVGRYASDCMRVNDPIVAELVQFLVPVEETPSRWLKREHNIAAGAEILDALVKAGRLTLAEIQEIKAKLNRVPAKPQPPARARQTNSSRWEKGPTL